MPPFNFISRNFQINWWRSRSSKILRWSCCYGACIAASYLAWKAHQSNNFPFVKKTVTFCDPIKIPYIVIGSGASAYYTVETILLNDPKAKILLISNSNNYPFCFMNAAKNAFFYDEIQKSINGEESSLYSYPVFKNLTTFDNLLSSEEPGVTVFIQTNILSLNSNNKTITLDNGQPLSFEKLCIAQDWRKTHNPVFDNLSEECRSRVIFMNDMDDYKKLIDVLKAGKSLTVVGLTPLSLSLSYSLSKLKKKNDFSFRFVAEDTENSFLSEFPDYLRGYVLNDVTNNCDNFYMNKKIEKVVTADERLLILTDDKKTHLSDYIVVFENESPDYSFHQSNRCIGNHCPSASPPFTGGYEVDAHMSSINDNGIYIAGNNVIYTDNILKEKHSLSGLIHSVTTAKHAGRNMTGLVDSYEYLPYNKYNITNNLKVIISGSTDASLQTVGFWKLSSDDLELRNRKGVVFYHKDDIIVGILMWNIFKSPDLCDEIVEQRINISQAEEVAKWIIPFRGEPNFKHFDPSKKIEDYENNVAA